MKFYKYEFNTNFFKSMFSVSTVKLTHKYYSYTLNLQNGHKIQDTFWVLQLFLSSYKHVSSFYYVLVEHLSVFSCFAVQISNQILIQNKIKLAQSGLENYLVEKGLWHIIALLYINPLSLIITNTMVTLKKSREINVLFLLKLSLACFPHTP